MNKNFEVTLYLISPIRLFPSLLKVLCSPERSILQKTFNVCSAFMFRDEDLRS
jgi:hypothetical protein